MKAAFCFEMSSCRCSLSKSAGAWESMTRMNRDGSRVYGSGRAIGVDVDDSQVLRSFESCKGEGQLLMNEVVGLQRHQSMPERHVNMKDWGLEAAGHWKDAPNGRPDVFSCFVANPWVSK